MVATAGRPAALVHPGAQGLVSSAPAHGPRVVTPWPYYHQFGCYGCSLRLIPSWKARVQPSGRFHRPGICTCHVSRAATAGQASLPRQHRPRTYGILIRRYQKIPRPSRPDTPTHASVNTHRSAPPADMAFTPQADRRTGFWRSSGYRQHGKDLKLHHTPSHEAVPPPASTPATGADPTKSPTAATDLGWTPRTGAGAC